jgi:hypothetical protein
MIGSNQVFLRHFDGKLQVHENQSFYAMTEEQENEVRESFESLPEDEEYPLPENGEFLFIENNEIINQVNIYSNKGL